jgi:hypothetical protein
MMDLLLRSGADATLVDENGWSAHRYAKKAGFSSIASKCPEVPYSLMQLEKTRYIIQTLTTFMTLDSSRHFLCIFMAFEAVPWHKIFFFSTDFMNLFLQNQLFY